MSELQGVLFDAGHTLFWFPNWARINVRSLEGVRAEIRQLGFDVDIIRIQTAIEVAAQRQDYTVPSMEEQFGAVLCSLGVFSYDSVDIMRVLDAYWNPIIQNARARKGGLRIMQEIRTAEFRLGVVSNFWSNALIRILNRLSLTGYFDAVVTSVDFGFRKPHPSIFRFALEEIQIDASKAIMVGDDPETDILGAHRTGMLTARLTRGPNRTKPNLVEPDFLIRNLSSLKSIVHQNKPSL
ncbi:MAG: HAD family hydrolase [Candidatus Thorarchaeota archaeon]